MTPWPASRTWSGSDLDDAMLAAQGDNLMSGGDGNDLLAGGSDEDELAGEDGNDQIFGEPENDELVGGPGDDLLDGGAGTDSCDGGSGSNQLQGGCDTTPPNLDDFDVSPASVNTASGSQQVTFTRGLERRHHGSGSDGVEPVDRGSRRRPAGDRAAPGGLGDTQRWHLSGDLQRPAIRARGGLDREPRPDRPGRERRQPLERAAGRGRLPGRASSRPRRATRSCRRWRTSR